MLRIIGLGHYSRTGKDTFANYYIEYLRYIMPEIKVVKKALAWKLKQITFELYAWDGMREPEYYETPEGALARDVKLPTLGMTPVEIWVAFGTPAVREHVYDRTWLDYLLKTDHGCNILVIPDIRFPNEAKAVKELGGTLIKVVRPGYGPRNTVADRALLGYAGWDYVIGGEGTMESLEDDAHWFATHHVLDTNTPPQSKTQREANLAVEKI
jgi:hypothetical protein